LILNDRYWKGSYASSIFSPIKYFIPFTRFHLDLSEFLLIVPTPRATLVEE